MSFRRRWDGHCAPCDREEGERRAEQSAYGTAPCAGERKRRREAGLIGEEGCDGASGDSGSRSGRGLGRRLARGRLWLAGRRRRDWEGRTEGRGLFWSGKRANEGYENNVGRAGFGTGTRRAGKGLEDEWTGMGDTAKKGQGRCPRWLALGSRPQRPFGCPGPDAGDKVMEKFNGGVGYAPR